MSLNIKNAQTETLIRELADLTGENMTIAITVAVKERRDRLLRESAGGLEAQLLEIGEDCAKRLPAAVKQVDHGHVLYGQDGLP